MAHRTRSIVLDDEVWAALGSNDLSANQLLRLQLGLDTEIKPRKGRLTRLEREIQAREAADVTARLVERNDVDYSDLETGPSTHIATLGEKVFTEALRRGPRQKGDKTR